LEFRDTIPGCILALMPSLLLQKDEGRITIFNHWVWRMITSNRIHCLRATDMEVTKYLRLTKVLTLTDAFAY
jgi:hypothetical protein